MRGLLFAAVLLAGCDGAPPAPLAEPVPQPDPERVEAGKACAAITKFGPSMVIVSLGLDTFFTDPISDLSVTQDGFKRSGDLVRQMALPTVVLQEGGYDVDALGNNVQAWLHGLAS
jgi:acetoin utilization deacetylase AcuC-like enzyme